MTAVDDLDQLLRDRFDMDRAALVSALRSLPSQRAGATRLTVEEASLLDAAGLTEDRASFEENVADVSARMGRLFSTAYSAANAATGLGVTDSRLRQRRSKRTVWALDDGGSWVYPAIQFEAVHDVDGARLQHVRGLDRVLPHVLSREVHPVAVEGFLVAPQTELSVDGRPLSVRQWLLSGGSADRVLQLVDISDWAGS